MSAPDTGAERAELEVLRKALNRRAAIEEQLWAIFHGKRPPPTPEECREWAIKLGIPDQYQPKGRMEMHKHQSETEMPAIGDSFGGGYYGGLILIDGQRFALIVAPRDEGEIEGAPWHGSYESIDGALSYCDGAANTRAMAEAGSELAQWAEGLQISGHGDWYLPSQDELEILYRAFKPADEENDPLMRSGINLSAPEPTRPYIPSHPSQTPLAAFQSGGGEAFADEWYWTSTQSASYSASAWAQYFSDGYQNLQHKALRLRARAVRRLTI